MNRASPTSAPARPAPRVVFVAAPPPSSAEDGLDALVELLADLWATEALDAARASRLTGEDRGVEDGR